MEKKTVWRQFNALPAEAQQEVSDFIAFLHSRKPTSVRVPRRKRKLSDEPFVGMWKDRKDIADSVEYVRELRRKHWRSDNERGGLGGHKHTD
jgi:hypothetical protein